MLGLMTRDTIMRGRKAVNNLAAHRQSVGYIRVPTDEQARDGVSLAAQEERLRAYALATGRNLGQIIADDGASAKNLKRSGVQRILDGIRSGHIGSVVILKLDRLTRSVRDLSNLLELFNKHNVALISITETLDTGTATGRMLMNIIITVAQWEREAIGERTAFALSHLRRNRRIYGPVPFGWRRRGNSLVAHPEQQRALSLAGKMLARGASFREIAAQLNACGVHCGRAGRAWYASTVRSILNSKAAAETAGHGPTSS